MIYLFGAFCFGLGLTVGAFAWTYITLREVDRREEEALRLRERYGR